MILRVKRYAYVSVSGQETVEALKEGDSRLYKYSRLGTLIFRASHEMHTRRVFSVNSRSTERNDNPL